MLSGVTTGRVATSLLMMVLTLLICAGCNLNSSHNGANARIEGPPVIHIAAPLPNQTFLAGTTVIVQARVENAGPDLSRIAVLLDEALLGERHNPNETNAAVLPLTIDWPTSIEGQYTISVVAERGDGSSVRENVSILVIPRTQYEVAPPIETASEEVAEQPPQEEDSGQSAENDATGSEPAEAAQATATATKPASGGPSQVAGTVIRPAPLRPGPGVASGQPIGNLMVDDEIVIIGVNPARNWYFITHGTDVDAWIDAGLVSPAGDISGVPVLDGPSLPDADGVNLVVTDVRLEPDPPVCGQPTTVHATVRNAGNVNSQTSPWVSAKAHLLSDQSVQAENPETTYLTKLEAGEEAVLDISLMLTGRFAELHEIRVTVDEGNHVLEVYENDNVGTSRQFELSQGSCST